MFIYLIDIESFVTKPLIFNQFLKALYKTLYKIKLISMSENYQQNLEKEIEKGGKYFGYLGYGLKNHLEKLPFKYGYEQTFFPIVQGSTYKDLRKQSAEYIASKDAVGNAIGGLSVGEPAEEMYGMTEVVCDILPEEKPRYLMGVGTPINILENIICD